MTAYDIETPVLIAGGGMVGMVLALELNLHGVAATVCERNPQTTQHPKMDIANGRTMELLRRLGVSAELRARAIPESNPFSVVWATALNGWELARFDYPPVTEMRKQIKANKDGTLASEPTMRISQAEAEPVLKNILVRDGKHIDLRFGWQLESFTQDDTGVTATICHTETAQRKTVRSHYLIGCDGANSFVRRGLRIRTHKIPLAELLYETGGVVKNLFYAGRNYLRGQAPPNGDVFIIHFASKDKAKLDRFGVAWHLQNPSGATLIGQNDRDIWTLHIPLRFGQRVENIDPRALLFETLGEEIDADILLTNRWRLQFGLATAYGKGRVWLAGDSAHQFSPTGGYGLNTGIGDAIDLGWKLAAMLKGWGGDMLLRSYQNERRPIAHRNRDAAKRHTITRLLISRADTPATTQDTPEGAQARQKIGAYITALGNLENEAHGIEFGYRYRGSPIICYDDGAPPPDAMAHYTPSSYAGARPPAFWIDDDTALFDLFDPTGFTLLRFGKTDVAGFMQSAQKMQLPLKLVECDDPKIRKLYERDLVLLRPDQHVCWRGDSEPPDVESVLKKVSGWR